MKKLDRDLGLVSVIAIAIGSMVGGGIFVLPGLAAAKTGPSFWLAYLLAGLFVIPAALSQSEMATAMPKAGGVYVFVDRSMGPLFGTIAGIGTWLAMLFKASFALVGISVYLSMFATVSYRLVALTLLIVVAGLNMVGVKKVGKAQVVVVIACLISLGILIIKGSTTINMANYNNHFSDGAWGLFATTGLVFISYAGVTKIASIAEEIINPSRNLPLAMLLSLAVMMVLYSLVGLVLVGVVPMKAALGTVATKAGAGVALVGNQRAVALLGELLLGTPGKIMMSVIAIVALASMANAGLLAASRYPLAMSRDAMIPSIFQRINERFVTPIISIVFTALCMAVAIGFLPVVKIAKLASGMQVLLFMAINIAIIILRESQPQWYKPKFHSPLYPGIQIFGILGCLLLLVMLGSFVLTGTALLLLLGALWFFYYARHKTQRRGVIQKMRKKPKTATMSGAALSENEEVSQSDDEQKANQTDLVIPLSGNEFSPESLLSIGAALGAHKISVLDLKEIPDQLQLTEELLEETPQMLALRRRVQLMSKRLSVDSEIDFIASHDRRHALYEYVKESDPACVLVDMGPHQNFHKVRRYLGWLASHLPCSLAVYQNEGFHITSNILVLVGSSPSEVLVVEIANKLAEMYDARMTLLSIVEPNTTDEVKAIATQRLEDFRGRCTVPHVTLDVVEGDLHDVVVDASISHELMVMGFPRASKQSWWKGSPMAHNRLLEEVACSVLSIKSAEGQIKPLTGPITLQHATALLDPRTIRMQYQVSSEAELLSHFAQLFAKVTGNESMDINKTLEQAKRETIQKLGRGVALLHATSETLEQTRLGMIFLDAPIPDADAYEGVDIIALSIGPASHLQAEAHLRTLLLELLADESWLGRLRAAPNTKGVLQLFRARANFIQASLDTIESRVIPNLETEAEAEAEAEADTETKAEETKASTEEASTEVKTDTSEANEAAETSEAVETSAAKSDDAQVAQKDAASAKESADKADDINHVAEATEAKGDKEA